ncbi:TPA: PTS transporter subunit EIIB, partial [Enterococcus faecium]
MAKNELTLEELAKQIYKGAGGMGNVESIVHCMTRVRMKIINDDLVNVSELK